jgi:hypothetical protein
VSSDRVVAWDAELRAVHARLREALAVARAAVDSQADADTIPDAAAAASADLLLYCTGFCAALDGHHRSEDAGLFPALEAEHPDLAPTIRKLMQDHSMLNHLLMQFRGALQGPPDRAVLRGHLEGIAAIMESHFRYEERELLEPLAALRSSAEGRQLLGPLA